MARSCVFLWILVGLVCLSAVNADLSVQHKGTTAGVVGGKDAELRFDVVNTDLTHNVMAFLHCLSPDEAYMYSNYGAGAGGGAQYVSPKFTMGVGPSQQELIIYASSETIGEKRLGCSIWYVPYKVSLVQSSGYTQEINQFLRINGEYVSEVADADYREIRIDRTAPFGDSVIESPQQGTDAVPQPPCIDVDGDISLSEQIFTPSKVITLAQEIADRCSITPTAIEEAICNGDTADWEFMYCPTGWECHTDAAGHGYCRERREPIGVPEDAEASPDSGADGIVIQPVHLLLAGIFVVLVIGVFLVGRIGGKGKPKEEVKEPIDFCPHCGERLGAGDAFCPSCGKKAR